MSEDSSQTAGPDDASVIAAARREAEQAGRRRGAHQNARALSGTDRSATLAAVQAQDDSQVGGLASDSFPGYELLREIHRGGQGVVYRAIQKSTKRRVAVKFMREGPFASAHDRARFEREVQVLGQLKHPNIVTIHDSGQAAGHFFLVMDYIPGQPLDVFMSSQKRSVRETLQLFATICDAVNAAHLKGVIHRDLKPGNIRVDDAGRPHVLDFGLAKVTVAGEDAMTVTGQFVGSLPWASPEQAAGTPDRIDTRTDVYALGVVLYQMLTGRFPYPVTGPVRDVLDNIMRAAPARPRTIGWHGRTGREIDDEVETIVLKCLSKEQERRYQTAGELGRDIERYLRSEPIEAKRDSGWYVLRKTVRRHRVSATIAALFLLLLSGSALALSIMYGKQTQALHDAQLAQANERREREHAVAAQELAESREKQAKRIADFQADMLTGINVEQMGTHLRADLLAEARAMLERTHCSAPQIADHIGALEKLLAGVNFTTAAARNLDRNVLQRALETIERDLNDQPLVQASLLETVSGAFHALGLFEQGIPPQEKALLIRRRLLGDEHSETLTSIHNMGVMLQLQGKLAEAERYYREALDAYRRIHGDEYPETLTLSAAMGSLLFAQGKLAEAERFGRDTLEKRRRNLGDDHPDTLASIDSLGLTVKAQGQFAEAEAFLREALERRRRVLGDEHPDTLASLTSMASLYFAQGRWAETEPYMREALEKRRRILGDDHPDTLSSLNSMGALMNVQGQLPEGEAYLREALDRHRRLFGDEHPDTWGSMSGLSALLFAQGKLAEAEFLLLDVLEKRRRALGGDHPDTIASEDNLGRVLRAQGRLPEAEQHFAAALGRRRRLLGDEHPDTLISIQNLGSLLKAQGRFREAEPLLREAAKGLSAQMGEEFLRTCLAHVGLGETLVALGRHEEAQEELLAAERCFRQAPSTTPAQRERCLKSLIELYESWHAAEPNQAFDARAAEWRMNLEQWQASTQPAATRVSIGVGSG